MKKVCRVCKKEKYITEFHKNGHNKNGSVKYHSECKSCKNENRKNKIFREHNKEYQIDYYYKNREKTLERVKKYKEKKKSDPIYVLIKSARRRLLNYLKSIDKKKNKKTDELLGCSREEFKNHIESLFSEGMNWNNHGTYGWHLDHKIPLSSAKTENEVHSLCHYTNLQPLWWYENLSKGNKIIIPDKM